MSWTEGPLAAFDLETTSADPTTARIVTATVLRITGNNIAEQAWISDVDGQEIPEAAAQIHGITTEFARENGDPAAEVTHDIRAALEKAWADGLPVVIYNAPYDLTVMTHECRRHGLGAFPIGGPVLDPYLIDKRVDRYRHGSRKLAATARYYGVQLDNAHASSDDALAAARVMWKIGRRFPEKVGDVDLGDLHEAQIGWHEEWATNYEVYLRSKKSSVGVSTADVRVDRGWPVRSTS